MISAEEFWLHLFDNTFKAPSLYTLENVLILDKHSLADCYLPTEWTADKIGHSPSIKLQNIPSNRMAKFCLAPDSVETFACSFHPACFHLTALRLC